MNHISKISIAALALSLAGCGIDLDEEDDDQVGETSSEVMGSTADTSHDDACIMEVTRPLSDDGQPPNPLTIRCSCTLVETQTVLTSAECVAEIVDKESPLTDIDLRFGDSFSGGAPVAVESIELHRYYDAETGGPDQLALLRLAESPGVTPAELNIDDAPQPAMPVTLVGYGDSEAGEGSRRLAETPIVTVNDKFILAGTTDITTCADDSGGGVYASFNGEDEVLVAVTGSQQGGCSATVQRLRVDTYANFIVPYVDYYSGACPHDDADTCSTEGCRTPDPDCPESSCNWGNECDEDCPTRDWDCPLGKFIGDECAASGECEEGGRCIPATDDESFTYCSRPCNMGVDGTCPAGMECSAGDDGDECVFLEPSPGSQGAACSDNSGCRSDICENDICVFPCDGANPCEPPYQCGPSTVADGMMVCLGNVVEGGGGFGLCAAGGDSRGWLSALGLLTLAFVVRRRRRADNA